MRRRLLGALGGGIELRPLAAKAIVLGDEQRGAHVGRRLGAELPDDLGAAREMRGRDDAERIRDLFPCSTARMSCARLRPRCCLRGEHLRGDELRLAHQQLVPAQVEAQIRDRRQDHYLVALLEPTLAAEQELMKMQMGAAPRAPR